MKKDLEGKLQVISATFLGGFIPILARFGGGLGVYALTFFRIFVAMLSLGIFLGFSKTKLVPLKYEKLKLLFFGAIHGVIILLYFIALNYMTISAVVLLFATYPIWMAILSRFILKEKIHKRAISAIIIAFIGVMIISSPDRIFVEKNFIGPIAILMAAFFAATVYVLSKTFKKYDKVSLTFWQNTIALPFVIPLLFINFPTSINIAEFFVIISMGSVFTASPFVLVYKGLHKIKAHQGGVLMLMEVLVPIVLALIIFREIPSISIIFGGILVLIGAYLIVSSKH
ncbi:MAG: DMT family transporter [archaeon]